MKSGKGIDELAKKNGRPKSSDALQASIPPAPIWDEEATRNARETLLNNEDVASVDPNFPVMTQPVRTPRGAPRQWPTSNCNQSRKATPSSSLSLTPLYNGKGTTSTISCFRTSRSRATLSGQGSADARNLDGPKPF